MPSPKPIPTAHVCSECGLDWQRHGNKPTLAKCVELLRVEVARLKGPKSKSMEYIGQPYLWGGETTKVLKESNT